MPILTILLFLAVMVFQGCNVGDAPRSGAGSSSPSVQLLEKAAVDSANQNRPSQGVYKDPESGNLYHLNTGWRIVPRQPKTAALAKTSGLIQTWTDRSGQIETRIYECSTPSPAQHQSLACQVENGFVAVGGGAYVQYGTGTGALLWESRIADDGYGNSPFVTWLASSKDHNYPCPHTLYTYVIGMRLKDNSGNYMDPSILRSKIHLHKYTTSPASHSPSLYTNIAQTSVSMGARMNWSGAGSLLTATGSNIPGGSYSRIYASGKDHIVSDPSTISLYSVDVDPDGHSGLTLPNFGTLYFNYAQCDGSAVSTGIASTFCDVDPGWVMVGMGGESRWNSGSGRLLFGIKPTGTYNGQVGVYSKDHRSVSGGYNHVTLTEAIKG